ncbi:hypothetical protein BS78_K290500, partial [Paspalum vaginatum]
MEKGQDIAASDERPEQHAIDVGHVEHGDGKGQDTENERVTVAEEVQKKCRRVAALDDFRGLTIVLMILVDDGGGAYERIDHSPWNGCTLADFRVPNISAAVKKITLRTLKMLFWGVLLQGGYSHAPDGLSYGMDMKKIRWCGILQKALVYFVVALIEAFTIKVRPTMVRSGPCTIFDACRWQWLGGFIGHRLCHILDHNIYIVTTFSLYVLDWSFVYHNDDVNDGKQFTVQCGVGASLDQACNAVGYVDRKVWGINHLYTQPVWIRSKDCTFSSPNMGPLRADAPAWCLAPFEPEGLLSSISSILSGTIGIHYGHVLIHFKTHKERLKHWLVMGFSLLALGILLHFTKALPINKQLYSFSYVCFTGGGAGIVLSAFYLQIDVWGLRTPFLFLEWIGMNAMLVFVLGAQGILAAFVNGWYYESPENSLVHCIVKHAFVNVWHSQRLGTLLYVIFCEIVFWGVAASVLHKLGIY